MNNYINKVTYNNINATELVDDFIDANIDFDISNVFCLDGALTITFTNDVDMQLVERIIDAHNSTPITSILSLEDYVLDLEFRLAMLEMTGGA